ncbi:peptidase inhibitor family I36 protein [Streptomyces mirabilis]|uniref:peptidase inhibitor family I36 protein n=1 Tax=Streptomyces mirabilis TaxID=68239 RepID=UPI0036A0BD22
MTATVKHAVAAIALSLLSLALAAPAQADAPGKPSVAHHQAVPASGVRDGVDCPDGYVCIYPEVNFGGQPWVKRAVDGSVKDLPSAIRDRGSSIRNNSGRTARVYEKRNYAGRWVCVTKSGGSIHDLRGYNLNDQTRSLKINRNDCG